MIPETALAEIERLERLVYVPGLTKCGKCGFRLVSSTLNSTTGAVRADVVAQRCPNDGEPMFPVTERDSGNDLCDRLDRLTDDFNDCNSERARWKDRATLAESRLAEAVKALEEIGGASEVWADLSVNRTESLCYPEATKRIAQKALASIRLPHASEGGTEKPTILDDGTWVFANHIITADGRKIMNP